VKEQDIQSEILNVLRRIPWIWPARNNTGKLPNPEGQLVSFGLATGSADVLVCVGPLGRWVGLEVKKPKKDQTEFQRAWAEEIRARGGFVFVARELDVACSSVLEVYRLNLDLLRRAGDITELEMDAQLKIAVSAIAKAKSDAAQVAAEQKKRRTHMPKRKPLPRGAQKAATF